MRLLPASVSFFRLECERSRQENPHYAFTSLAERRRQDEGKHNMSHILEQELQQKENINSISKTQRHHREEVKISLRPSWRRFNRKASDCKRAGVVLRRHHTLSAVALPQINIENCLHQTDNERDAEKTNICELHWV